MAEINMNVVKGPELKTHIATLNECGLLPEPIVVRPGRKNVDLAAEFVAGIEATNDIGKLDDVPEQVFNYYTQIVVPTKAAAPAAAAPATAEAPAPAAPAAKPAGRGRGKAAAAPATKPATKPAAAPAEKKLTRIGAIVQIFHGMRDAGEALAADEVIARLNALYGGSEREASFQVPRYLNLLAGLGIMTKNEDKTFTYNK